MADLFKPAPEPKTELGRYRILSSTASIRASPLALGAMSIGQAWAAGMGSMDKEQSFKLLDAYYDAGGNFIDTANNYQDEESETWIGEWMKGRGNRDNLVIATKYSIPYTTYREGKGISVNKSGNSKRSMMLSIRDSLKKLQTDYIDIFYLHVWDHTTSIEEIMDSLHILVESGKVMYLGISDTPAWVVSACNYYARAHGKTPFSIYQGRWNVMLRDFEREILPMARHFGMALAPWDVMGSGHFQTKKQMEERKKNNEGVRSIMAQGQSEDESKMSDALEKVAKRHNTEAITAIAIAYVMAKAPHVFPIIGGRKVEHLHANIEALKIKLSDEDIQELEAVVPMEVGFPHNFIGPDPKTGAPVQNLILNAAPMSYVRSSKPIGHE